MKSGFNNGAYNVVEGYSKLVKVSILGDINELILQLFVLFVILDKSKYLFPNKLNSSTGNSQSSIVAKLVFQYSSSQRKHSSRQPVSCPTFI